MEAAVIEDVSINISMMQLSIPKIIVFEGVVVKKNIRLITALVMSLMRLCPRALC